MISLNSCSKLSSQTSLMIGASARLCIWVPVAGNVSAFTLGVSVKPLWYEEGLFDDWFGIKKV